MKKISKLSTIARSLLVVAALTAATATYAQTETNPSNQTEMNEVIKIIKQRRSTRKYTTEVPSRELLEQVAEAGLYAPSGMGTQNTKILMVSNPDMLSRLRKLNAQVIGRGDMDPYYGAPVLAVVIGDRATPTIEEDGVLVLENMMLAAESLGLSSCYIHRAKPMFETEEGKLILKELGIEGDWIGIGHIILGYDDGGKRPAAERKAGRVVFCE